MRPMRRAVFGILAAAGVAATPGVALAQASQDECSTLAAAAAGAKPIVRLSLLYQTDCLGGGKDLDPLTRRAMKLLPQTNAESESSKIETRLLVLAAIDPVLQAAGDRAKRPGASAQGVVLRNLEQSVAAARAAVDALLPAADVRMIQTGSWKWDTNRTSFGFLDVPVGALVGDACAESGSASCQSACETAAFVLRSAKLVERGLTYYARPLLETARAETATRDARWTAYFDDTLQQFPWELALNSALFSRAARAKAGFAPPPGSQWVFVHPMAGLEYIGSAPQGSRMVPAVAVEALGYNRWRWNSDNKAAHALGVSAVIAFTDRAGTSSVGYGALFRYGHRYALSVTRRSGKTGFLLSSDLAQWLNGKQQKAKDAMRLLGR